MNIFYSWQSDLPIKNNRNFIEDCVKTAIKELNRENRHLVNFSLDRDTSGEPGNPEIVNLILEKIDKSRVFICDLSIINAGCEARKTPNPNVVFELGYAIKSLGWEKTICIVNEEFGKIDELPFDIKHRRLLSYDISLRDRSLEKKRIVNAIKATINILKERGLLHDEVEDYFKRDIDTEFLSIVNHLRKLIFSEISPNLLIDAGKLLNLSKSELISNISGRKILGFHLFKNFSLHSKSLKRLIDTIVSVSHFKKEKVVVLVKFMEWLDRYNKFTNGRTYKDLFVEVEKASGYKLLGSNNQEMPNRALLGKILDDSHVVVSDFGDIILKSKIEKSLYYFTINESNLESYGNLIFSFIEIANDWLDKSGGEFVIDTFNQFEMR